jgi:myo-inositol-1(or 4)-monophosphatase
VQVSEYLFAAIKAARAAGKIHLKYFRNGVSVSYKSKKNPVTAADKLSEAAVLKILKKRFPGHGLLCEETCSSLKGVPKGESSHFWSVDPLDGTVNFIHGLGQFCVSIGLLKGGVPVVGVILNPVTEELFYAEKGTGAYLNGRRIRVSGIGSMEKALLVTGFPYAIKKREKRVIRLLKYFMFKSEGVRRLGSAALDMAHVANGVFEGFWEEGLNPWDVAAGAVIVREAGGRVTDYAGGDDFIFGKTLLCSNGLLHHRMLKLF